jgi:hypothetical protein
MGLVTRGGTRDERRLDRDEREETKSANGRGVHRTERRTRARKGAGLLLEREIGEADAVAVGISEVEGVGGAVEERDPLGREP